MTARKLLGRLIQLSHAPPSTWLAFVSGWIHRRREGVVPCVIPTCARLLYVPLRDFYDSYEFFCESAPGRRELGYFLSKLRRREVLYDIGGFRGAYSAGAKLMLEENISIHVFEPVAGNVEAIERVSRLNKFADFQIVGSAVGDGTALSGALNPLNLMLWAGEGRADSPGNSMPSVAIDDYVARGAPPPTILKIDVEGFDLEVLRGARKCLGQHHPRLWLEVHTALLSALGKSDADVLNFLRETGYEPVFFEDHDFSDSPASYHVWCS